MSSRPILPWRTEKLRVTPPLSQFPRMTAPSVQLVTEKRNDKEAMTDSRTANDRTARIILTALIRTAHTAIETETATEATATETVRRNMITGRTLTDTVRHTGQTHIEITKMVTARRTERGAAVKGGARRRESQAEAATEGGRARVSANQAKPEIGTQRRELRRKTDVTGKRKRGETSKKRTGQSASGVKKTGRGTAGDTAPVLARGTCMLPQ